MKTGKLLYGITGLALAIATAATGSYGLSERNQKIYEQAISLQPEVDKLGFQDFWLAEYKVRFFDGDVDYVVKDGAIKKEKPVFSTFVGTTYEVDGEYQVILPVVENFAEMFDLLGAADALSEGSVTFEKNTYGEAEHTATLWHETFHAYQMSHYQDQVMGLLQGKQFEDGMENVIVEGVDSGKNMVSYFQEEAGLLRQAYFEQDQEEKKALIRDYLKLDQQRRELLSKDACVAEDYYETIEGCACYVESCIISSLKGKEEMEKQYIDHFAYSNGTGKYYKIGMLKCYLLNQTAQGWSGEYKFESSLNELLEEAVQ